MLKQSSVVHFKTVAEAAKGLVDGQVSAVLGTRAEVEAALVGQGRFAIDTPKFAELKIDSWPLGMAVKAEEAELAAAIGSALADLKRDGSIAAIFKRHGISYLPA